MWTNQWCVYKNVAMNGYHTPPLTSHSFVYLPFLHVSVVYDTSKYVVYIAGAVL